MRSLVFFVVMACVHAVYCCDLVAVHPIEESNCKNPVIYQDCGNRVLDDFYSKEKRVKLSYARGQESYSVEFVGENNQTPGSFYQDVCFSDRKGYTVKRFCVYEAPRVACLRGIFVQDSKWSACEFLSPELKKFIKLAVNYIQQNQLTTAALFSQERFYPKGFTRCWKFVPSSSPFSGECVRISIGKLSLEGRLVAKDFKGRFGRGKSEFSKIVDALWVQDSSKFQLWPTIPKQ